MRIYIIFLMIIFILVGCSKQNVKIENNANKFAIIPPSDIYIVDSVLTTIDSIYVYYDSARKFLNKQDTIGASIYFENAFNLIQGFDEDTKSLLMEWSAYDSLLFKLNEDYARIQDPYSMDFEAEEIREELIAFEEESISDFAAFDSIKMSEQPDSMAIPLEVNKRVKLAMQYFQTKGRKVFNVWLKRLGKYEKMIKDILIEEGMPTDLCYLAMIESGFNPKAYSYARASGMWQFIYATGIHYGLRGDWWFDERRDPTLSTRAAAKHLRDLYDRFGHWYLALAGYNYSPGKLARKIRQYNTNDFWKIKRLPRQTRNYIPTYIAATILAKNPEKYGFYVEKSEPVKFDTVKISECVDLNVIAESVNSSFKEIKSLNPAVKRWCTPPGVKDFTVNLPVGTKELFKQKYAEIPDKQKRSYSRHRIKRGETLSEIASRYATSISVIKKLNKIRGSRIRAGKYLIIPVAQNKTYYKSFNKVAYKKKKKRSKPKPVANLKGHKKIIYSVKKGDTLGDIAELYNTRASKIRYWNGIAYGRHIYPNQKLAIWVPDTTPIPKTIKKSDQVTTASAENIHVVKSGDTLWDISRKYDISIRELKKINKLRSNRLKPGKRLVIKSEGK